MKDFRSHILFKKNAGVWLGLTIILFWVTTVYLLLSSSLSFRTPWPYLFILIMTHLYTGLFITTHDAIHGTVSPNKNLNDSVGKVAAILFAFNNFNSLKKKHYLHHSKVATSDDPDYSEGNFILWYYSFIKNYITWWQLILMAITYNILELYFDEINIFLFWMLPAIFATVQLFYFGTFLPHKGQFEAANIHKSSSQKKNHLWAFISCYFFGYHYEHHAYPQTPWWLLFKVKDQISR